eukprot:CAMPEP_0185792100 /NCGR_PEP_ID=MMETSP1174-20130828/158738_1 /TAXON_ID=35687 /ORGANISM="Dictyocha speculum, Strain CCMP1381" /LENGTH=264 /DNA_ID=CAMNT_0028487117 /DNA_START=585 /DNA_END=1379 /DNA_ORIENTATION=-
MQAELDEIDAQRLLHAELDKSKDLMEQMQKELDEIDAQRSMETEIDESKNLVKQMQTELNKRDTQRTMQTEIVKQMQTELNEKDTEGMTFVAELEAEKGVTRTLREEIEGLKMRERLSQAKATAEIVDLQNNVAKAHVEVERMREELSKAEKRADDAVTHEGTQRRQAQAATAELMETMVKKDQKLWESRYAGRRAEKRAESLEKEVLAQLRAKHGRLENDLENRNPNATTPHEDVRLEPNMADWRTTLKIVTQMPQLPMKMSG